MDRDFCPATSFIETHNTRDGRYCEYCGTDVAMDQLTVADVEAMVEETGLMGESDDKRAHDMEDRLRSLVLQTIASNATSDPAGLAAAALKTTELGFSRWCA